MASIVNTGAINPSSARSTGRAVFSMETVAYALLIVFAIVLRLAEVDTVPLREYEARQALAAWRVVQPIPGLEPIAPQSSLLFTGHVIAFTLLGASEFSARLLTILASVALLLSPLLFRNVLGVGRAFVLALLLVVSPIVLISSRTDSAMIWSALSVVLGLWAAHRYLLTGRKSWAVLVAVCLMVLIFLTDPTGVLTALIVLLAGYVAWQFTPKEIDDLPDEQVEALSMKIEERLRSWPRLESAIISLLVIVLLSTLVLIYPAGLNVIGESLSVFVRGLTTGQPGLPALFPILTTLFYEPWLVLLGLVAWFWLGQAGRITWLDRFAGATAFFGLVAGAFYRGAGADHALWLILPLALLVSHLVIVLLEELVPDPVWGEVPPWSRALIALVAFFLLAMLSIHLQSLGRSLLQAPDTILQPGSVNAVSLVWVVITLLFMVIGGFLAASVWRVPVTMRGALLGLMAFGLLTSLGSGWRAAVYTSANATEWWNREAVSPEVHLLRQTLIEVSTRETGGEPTVLPVVALVPPDGEVAWALREVQDIRFINDISEARSQEIVILPETLEPPDLGGPYVGKAFTIRQAWEGSGLQPIEFVAWYLQRRVREVPLPSERVVLWLRQDIYDGVPFQTQP